MLANIFIILTCTIWITSGCDVGYYTDTSNNCQICYSTCYTCHGALATDCSTCDTTPGTNPYFMITNYSCMSACPSGYKNVNYKCVSDQCDSTCFTCSGTSATICLSCDESGTHPYFISNNNTCMSACLIGYHNTYTQNPPGVWYKGCESCHPTCSTCDGSTATNCLT